MTRKKMLEKLGKLIVADVRDLTIKMMLGILDGTMPGADVKYYKKIMKQFNEKQRKDIEEIVISAVDRAVFNMMWMFEQNEESVVLGIVDGEKIVNACEISDGLAGETVTEKGWIGRFGEYPRVEDME